MAVQAFPYLVLTDGTDTVTFADGLGGITNYPPVRGQWAPAVAGLRDSLLGGRGPYADVAEDLSCNIRDTTAALCWSDLDKLARLLDKAQRWWKRNESSLNPVLLKYAPQGSTIASTASPLQALVLGRASSDELNGVVLPADVNDAGMLFEIYGVTVQCLRRGAWLGATETASSSSAANPSILTATLPSSTNTSSPIDIRLAGFGAQATPIPLPAGFVLVSPTSAGLLIQEAEALTATGYTSVADAGNNARGGSVLRYTPTGTAIAASGSANLTSLSGQVIGIYAAVRNNSAVATFQIDALISYAGGQVRTPTTLIDNSTTNPQVVYLGTVAFPTQAALLQFEIAASTTTGPPTLDIDYLVCIDLTDSTLARAIALPVQSVPATGVITNLGISVEHQSLTAQNPRVVTKDGTGGTPGYLSYRGDATLLSRGNTISAVVLMTGGPGGVNNWRYTNGGIISNTLNVTRQLAYLTPQ